VHMVFYIRNNNRQVVIITKAIMACSKCNGKLEKIGILATTWEYNGEDQFAPARVWQCEYCKRVVIE
jgi:hypothetical protein